MPSGTCSLDSTEREKAFPLPQGAVLSSWWNQPNSRELKATDTEVMLKTHPHGSYIPVPTQTLSLLLRQLLFFLKQHVRVSLASSEAFFLRCPTAPLPSQGCFWDCVVAVIMHSSLLAKGHISNSGFSSCLVSRSINQLCPTCIAGTA